MLPPSPSPSPGLGHPGVCLTPDQTPESISSTTHTRGRPQTEADGLRPSGLSGQLPIVPDGLFMRHRSTLRACCALVPSWVRSAEQDPSTPAEGVRGVVGSVVRRQEANRQPPRSSRAAGLVVHIVYRTKYTVQRQKGLKSPSSVLAGRPCLAGGGGAFYKFTQRPVGCSHLEWASFCDSAQTLQTSLSSLFLPTQTQKCQVSRLRSAGLRGVREPPRPSQCRPPVCQGLDN